MAKMMRQFELVSPTESGQACLTTWLEDDKRLKVGSTLTLKDWVDPERWWEITWASSDPKPLDEINRQWKVGGRWPRMIWTLPGTFKCCGQVWRAYKGWCICYRCDMRCRMHGNDWRLW